MQRELRYLKYAQAYMESFELQPGDAIYGRFDQIAVREKHAVLGTPLRRPYEEGVEVAYFAMGCFWGAERVFWSLDGVYTTATGYMGGETLNPSYKEVCSGMTGHTETVLVAYFPDQVSYASLVATFFEQHDPTLGPRQGNDVGMQYRSAIFTETEEQTKTALAMRVSYNDVVMPERKTPITTEINDDSTFFFAEDEHQQFLEMNPHGYCGLQANGLECPLPPNH